MKKIRKPENLIRFDSVLGVETGKRSIFNGRTYAYSAVLLILIVVLVITVSNRKPLETTMLRIPGSTFQQVDSVTYSNLYQVKIINKTETDKNIQLRMVSPKSGNLQLATGQTGLEKQGMLESVLIVNLNKHDLAGGSTNIKIGIFEDETLLEVYSTNFIGPFK
jgi:polyferredoxin